jgi:hypothetical protein
LGNRGSLLEPGQVNRVAEEAQLCSCLPKSHESVEMHELSHCHDGGTRSCFSTTDVFFSWNLLNRPRIWEVICSILSWNTGYHDKVFLGFPRSFQSNTFD